MSGIFAIVCGECSGFVLQIVKCGFCCLPMLIVFSKYIRWFRLENHNNYNTLFSGCPIEIRECPQKQQSTSATTTKHIETTHNTNPTTILANHVGNLRRRLSGFVFKFFVMCPLRLVFVLWCWLVALRTFVDFNGNKPHNIVFSGVPIEIRECL